MRLTTKIVLGIFVSIFLLSFGVIIALLFNVKKDNSYINDTTRIIMQENIISVDIEPYKTIWIDGEYTEDNQFYLTGKLLLKPVLREYEKNKLFLPEELLPFTDIISSNDTLIIRLKLEGLIKQYDPIKSKNKHVLHILDGVNFVMHPNTVDVISNINGIEIDIRNMKTDRIDISTPGEVSIDSCQVGRINPIMRGWRLFRIKNSQVKELNIDLDQMERNWQVENCVIEVENRTGSGNYIDHLPKGAAKNVNWIPKNKDAQMTMTLRGDTARIVFP